MNTRKGFTLVELLVVIAILAILATVSVVGYTTYINNANKSVATQELDQIVDFAMAHDLASGNKDGKVSVDEFTAALGNAGFNVSNFAITGTEGKTGTENLVTVVVYTHPTNKATATWTVSTGKIE